MRMLMNVGFPTPEFNALVAAGTAGQTMMAILEEQKPEAVYFTESHGGRGALLVVDLADPSKVPVLAEPWFLEFNATVEFRVVMSPSELGHSGLDELGKKWAPKG